MKFEINWGDGSIDTTTFVPSGTNKEASNIWVSEATYTITASAENIYGNIGSVSTFTVTIPRSKEVYKLVPRLFQIFPNAFPFIRLILGQYS